MVPKPRPILTCALFCLLALSVFFGGVAQAQVAKQGNDSLSSLVFQSERLAPSQVVEPLEAAQSEVSLATQNAWASFRLGVPSEWKSSVDRRNGLIAFAEGGNIAWIPGRGNSLTRNDIATFLPPGATKANLTALEAITRSFLPRVAKMIGVDASSLVLSHGRSGQPADHLWFVDFDVTRDGLTVEGARVVFRVNNGNLIQFGSENLPAPGTAVPATVVTRDQARAAIASYVGGFGSGDTFLDSGSLHLLPANVPSTRTAGFDFGNGRGLAKVWQLTFHRDGVMGTWQARVDATTGEVLELRDVNDYAQATGGIFQNSPTTGPEIVRPMPYTNLSTGGFANSAGLYTFGGGPLTSTLNGQYVRISDVCGAISLAAGGSGDLAFGTSGGTDCVTPPGIGGAGNTHSAREQFYQVNRIKEVGRGWLPSNTWLNQQLTVNVNLNQTCNAYWNGASLNFFKSGGGCGNTGEIAGVSLHEYGHGLDQNDGTGTAPEGGTGESYADITATIALHSSCVGPGFLGGNCGGYGDPCTACTGVRDMDFAKHVSNTPATVANFTQPRCGFGFGPCSREVHCESYVPSEAVWDFANRDLPGAGTGPAWTILDRLWYLSRNTATSSFTCNASGTFTSNGCGAGNWWKVMRAVDDDDGNLANGTPHGGALFAAFNRHGIACTTDPGAEHHLRRLRLAGHAVALRNPGRQLGLALLDHLGHGRLRPLPQRDGLQRRLHQDRERHLGHRAHRHQRGQRHHLLLPGDRLPERQRGLRLGAFDLRGRDPGERSLRSARGSGEPDGDRRLRQRGPRLVRGGRRQRIPRAALAHHGRPLHSGRLGRGHGLHRHRRDQRHHLFLRGAGGQQRHL